MTTQAYLFIVTSAFLAGSGLLIVRWWLIPRLRAISNGRQLWWQTWMSIVLVSSAVASLLAAATALVVALAAVG